MADLSQLTDEQLEVYRDLLLQKQSTPPSAAGKTADDVSRQILNGLTFGFGDNLEAAVGALPVLGDKKANESYSQAYNRNLAEVRNKMAAFQQERPLTAGALDITGGAIPAVISGGATAGASNPALLMRMLRSGTLGALYGAAGTAGNANVDTAPELLQAAKTGAMTGAATGAALPAISAGLRKGAEGLASLSLGIGWKDRLYGKTPAAAALDETSGLRPSSVARSASQKIKDLTNQLESAVQGKIVNITPAQALATAEANTASSGLGYDKLGEELQLMADRLKTAPPNFYGNTAWQMQGGQMARNGISGLQDGADAVRMKREFADRFLSWNPNTSDKAVKIGKKVYHELDKSIDAVSPEVASVNQRISSLIPVADRAANKSAQAGATQRTLQRGLAHTGALTGAVTGFAAGGPIGALLGLAGPELLLSPAPLMAYARAANAPSKAPESLASLVRYLTSQSARPLYQK